MKIGLLQILKNDEHAFALPNYLTLLRLAFLPIISYCIQLQTVHGDWFALFFIFCSGITDFFDGYVARKTKKQSELGKLLDPLVDKILVGVLMLFMAAYKSLPYWFVFMVIVRDVLILVAGLYLIKRHRNIAQSNMLGKLTLTSYIIVIFFYMMGVEPVNQIMMWISVLLIPASLLNYFRIYYSLLRAQNSGKKI